MLSKIFCPYFLSVVICGSSIQEIPAPNLEGKGLHSQRNYAKQIQPRTDLEDILDIKNLFSPGFGLFKNILPTQLSTRPERDARDERYVKRVSLHVTSKISLPVFLNQYKARQA